MKWIFFVLLFTAVSCMEDQKSPESALRDFIEGSVGNVITRQFVIDRVTGKMKESFVNMSEEDFAKFSDFRNIKKDSFKIVTKSCQEKKCFITYTIGFQTRKDDTKTFSSEVKKIAEVVQVEGKWLIADVSNIKTYHEALEPINALE